MINVSSVIANPMFASDFHIERQSGGVFFEGEYTENTILIDVTGVVQPYKLKTEEYDAAGNVIIGDIAVHTLFEIFTTRDDTDTGTSDIIIWKGERYKVKRVKNWSDNGYYKAIAERISPC